MSTYVRRVPARDGLGSSNVREAGDLTQALPTVSCDESVVAVGAAHRGQRASTVVVGQVVRHYNRVGRSDHCRSSLAGGLPKKTVVVLGMDIPDAAVARKAAEKMARQLGSFMVSL